MEVGKKYKTKNLFSLSTVLICLRIVALTKGKWNEEERFLFLIILESSSIKE